MSALSSAVLDATADELSSSLGRALGDRVTEGALPDGRDPAGRAGSPPPSLRVGVDLVPVADVAAAVERMGRRYLYRVFTPHERACARIGAAARPSARSRYSAQALAARFAAKEAAVKALRPHGVRPEWRSIEVRRMDGGWCALRLTGLAADLAAEAGISELSLSITHEPLVAAACVVGVSSGDVPARGRTSPPERKGL
jgi:holo-[acyl-carrier protein] synthase